MAAGTNPSRRRLAVRYGDRRIEFEVVSSPAQSSSVGITVDSLTGVRVTAPVDASDADIREAVRRRARWIHEHGERGGESPARKRGLGGEEVLYLGRRYLLKPTRGVSNSVKLKGGRLLVQLRDPQPSVITKAVEDWYRRRGNDYFERRIAVLFSSTLDERSLPPGFAIRSMRRQWGSCSPAGKLLLNPMLMRAPRACVDYVIAHELCHLQHHDHGTGFYRLLQARMPDWQERKSLLELVAEQVLTPFRS